LYDKFLFPIAIDNSSSQQPAVNPIPAEPIEAGAVVAERFPHWHITLHPQECYTVLENAAEWGDAEAQRAEQPRERELEVEEEIESTEAPA